MRRGLPATAVALVLAAGALGGCGEDPATAQARSALEASRADVRETAEELRDDVADRLDGRQQQAIGGWESCVSAFNETGTTFRYSASVRMTTDPAGRRLLGPAGEIAQAAGLRRTPGQIDEVRASRDDLEVIFWALPASTAGDLLVTVAGPCLEAPGEAQQELRDKVGPEEPLE